MPPFHNEDFQDHAALIWAALFASASPLTAEDLVRSCGIQKMAVLSVLSAFRRSGLLVQSNGVNSPVRVLTPLLWAHAAEVGIPLTVLESTVSLSVPDRRRAEQLTMSGQVEKDHAGRRRVMAKTRAKMLRGRAATRAAATDLARLIQDAEMALSSSPKAGEVNKAIQAEAQRALESLIKALEKT